MSSEAIVSGNKFVLNHLKICRLCLSEELLEDIFKFDDLQLWISDHLSILVSEDDNISCSICALCRVRLNEFRDFQQRCLEVQDVLQSKSSMPFDKDLPLSEAKKAKPSSEAQPELTINATEKLQPTILEIEDETDDDEKRLYQRSGIRQSGKKRYCNDEKEAPKNNKIECSTCGKKVHKSYIEGHQNRHKGIRPFICERGCKNVDFDSRQTQHQHHRDVHSEERYECDICNKVFHAKRHLSTHKVNIHWSKKFQCSICNLQYTSRPGLYNHMKRMHDPNREKTFACPHCNSSFKTYKCKQTHLLMIHRIGVLGKSKKRTKNKLVEKRDTFKSPKVSNDPEVNSVGGHLQGLFEAEAANIEPDSNTQQGQDDYISATEEDYSLLVSEGLTISDTKKELQSKDVLKISKKPTESSTPFVKDLPLGEAEIRECSSEAYTELTFDAREKLQPTIPDLEDEADDDENCLYERSVITQPRSKRYYYGKEEAYQNKKIECSTCGERVHKSCIESHQNRHKGVRPFKCERGCENVDFDSRHTQHQHHRDVHSEERYECNICNKVFRAKRHLRTHKVNIHWSKTFQCLICNLQYTSRPGLHNHMKRMHNPNHKRTFSCPHCNSSFKTYGYLQMHLSMTHRIGMLEKSKKRTKKKLVVKGDALEAPKVNDDPQVNSVGRHLDLIEAEAANIQPDSNTKQRQDDCISVTLEDNSLLVSEELKISDIKKELHSEDVLKISQIRTEYLPLGAEEIGKPSTEAYPELTFDAREKLQPMIPDIEDEADAGGKRLYQRIVISESRQKSYYFAKKETYQYGKKECSTCGERVHKSQIQIHQNRHTGVRPFKCELGCENVDFDSQRIQHQHHREVHSEEQYECNICNKVFRAQRHLSVHKVNVHSSKTFPCSICNLQYTSSSGLHRHTKKVHDLNFKRKFPCPHCDCSYYRNGYLQKHVKQMHLEEMLEKSKKIRKQKPVAKHNSLEALNVKIEPDVDYVETQDMLQDDSHAVEEGNLDLFEAEVTKIEPDLNE